MQTMTAGITVMKQAAATLVRVYNLNVTVAAASHSTGPVTATMTVETTVTRLMPTVPTSVRNINSRWFLALLNVLSCESLCVSLFKLLLALLT